MYKFLDSVYGTKHDMYSCLFCHSPSFGLFLLHTTLIYFQVSYSSLCVGTGGHLAYKSGPNMRTYV